MVMKAKKPVLLATLVVALLALGLILPATVAAGDDDSSSSVEGNCTVNMLPDVLIGFTIDVQQSEGGTLDGVVLQKIMRVPDPAWADVPAVRKATVFTIEYSPWVYPFGMSDTYTEYSSFHEAGDSYTWPADLPLPKLLADDPTAYDLANIADFVVALPTTNSPLPFDPWPHRYVVMDFGEPDTKDLVQIYGWWFDESGTWGWFPQVVYAGEFYAENPQYVPGDPIPVLKGDFQVEVGN